MKKLTILIMILLIFVLTSCSKPTRIETPPWNDKQTEQMKREELKYSPLLLVRF